MVEQEALEGSLSKKKQPISCWNDQNQLSQNPGIRSDAYSNRGNDWWRERLLYLAKKAVCPNQLQSPFLSPAIAWRILATIPKVAGWCMGGRQGPCPPKTGEFCILASLVDPHSFVLIPLVAVAFPAASYDFKKQTHFHPLSSGSKHLRKKFWGVNCHQRIFSPLIF